MDDDALSSIAPALEPTLVARLWLTGYLIRGGHHHVDLSTISATGARVISRSYPPAPQLEGQSSGHETDITARLFDRHLMGYFRNCNDSHYFGLA
jgi:hypothetical protein